MDRACGTVLGTAAGDALGAGYEFGTARVGPDGPQMIGGGLGGFAKGEWTDDTTMAWCVLDVASTGVDLRSDEALDEIARRFRTWYESGPADIGTQTRKVLRAGGADPTGATLTAISDELHARTGHTAGNGSLMRTAPVALRHLDDPTALTQAAVAVSRLTHADPRAGEACALWSHAIRHAVLTAQIDVRVGLEHLEAEAVEYWSERIAEAEAGPPGRFTPNGWVVTALQAAWSAIHHTPVPQDDPRQHLEDALAAAIAIGDDTDTVAAIAGGLLGARWGASAVPARWRRMLHGYPGLTGERLVELAHLAATGGRSTHHGWPELDYLPYAGYNRGAVLVRHPFDEGVWLGNVTALDDLPEEITAVVSLCLVGYAQVPEGVEHVVFRLIDEPAAESNRNLAFILSDVAATVAALRDEGHEVLVHCVAAQSRTPTVGIAYAMLRGVDYETASKGVCGALPSARPNAGFTQALQLLEEASTTPHESKWPGVGKIVQHFSGDIVASLVADTDALANALDPTWSKATLGTRSNSHGLVCFSSGIELGSDSDRRFYKAEHPFAGDSLRVTSQWYEDQRGAITDLLVGLGLIPVGTTDVEVAAEVARSATTDITVGGTRTVQVGGTLKGYPIGDAQNLAVRTVLDLTGAGPSQSDWQATIRALGSRCIYCEASFSASVKVVIDHVVPINKTDLGENVIGNVVPACQDCNTEKRGKSLELWLATTQRPIDRAAAHQRVLAHQARHGYVPLEERLGPRRGEVDEVIAQMRAEMLEAAKRCAALINNIVDRDDAADES
ncbi:ADP-ribosylglycohydrolase family protein [Janibacter sp. UYMM211]|uniref:ADP-ribosylglycohydrolase family protein n=1 Tax=Janibacter sp. UYMM211 TaxID=3156342 RepID=UPI00339631E4